MTPRHGNRGWSAIRTPGTAIDEAEPGAGESGIDEAGNERRSVHGGSS
jgi:hypothetical protein